MSVFEEYRMIQTDPIEKKKHEKLLKQCPILRIKRNCLFFFHWVGGGLNQPEKTISSKASTLNDREIFI